MSKKTTKKTAKKPVKKLKIETVLTQLKPHISAIENATKKDESVGVMIFVFDLEKEHTHIQSMNMNGDAMIQVIERTKNELISLIKDL